MCIFFCSISFIVLNHDSWSVTMNGMVGKRCFLIVMCCNKVLLNLDLNRIWIWFINPNAKSLLSSLPFPSQCLRMGTSHTPVYRQAISHISRDHFVYAPSQWETTLQCNVVSHWLGTCTEWSLRFQPLWSAPTSTITAVFVCKHRIVSGADGLGPWGQCWVNLLHVESNLGNIKMYFVFI